MGERFLRLFFSWVGATILVLLLSMIVIIVAVIPKTSGPREAFEAHLAALDAGEWQLSDTYAKPECAIEAEGVSEASLQEVIDSGFSYRRTFQVEDVWINEAGDEALLELQVSPDLPQVAVLDLVDGEWLITC